MIGIASGEEPMTNNMIKITVVYARNGSERSYDEYFSDMQKALAFIHDNEAVGYLTDNWDNDGDHIGFNIIPIESLIEYQVNLSNVLVGEESVPDNVYELFKGKDAPTE